MADEIGLNVDTRELDAALTKLPRKLRGAVMAEALQRAGNVMLAALVDYTPERTDEETPDSNSLPPGFLKASMTTEVIVPNAEGMVPMGRGHGRGSPRVKVGPQKVGAANKFGRVAYWQNNGWTLTGHASRTNPDGKRGKRGWKKGKEIKAIPGKHFIEAAFDESAQGAVDAFLEGLAAGLFGDESTYADDNYGGENY
jgi:hypothetical protein